MHAGHTFGTCSRRHPDRASPRRQASTIEMPPLGVEFVSDLLDWDACCTAERYSERVVIYPETS